MPLSSHRSSAGVNILIQLLWSLALPLVQWNSINRHFFRQLLCLNEPQREMLMMTLGIFVVPYGTPHSPLYWRYGNSLSRRNGLVLKRLAALWTRQQQIISISHMYGEWGDKPLTIRQGSLGERRKFSSGVWGGATTAKALFAISVIKTHFGDNNFDITLNSAS